ncbi:hypothetical protein QAD02_007102 [Eretmocerus hayati]|uniref:Uncharacterized protein n=1 Tax=Eretmocerus hayati TaxID=131215 RepID=A0ACC2N2P8_9HYME|nr:hypothetical protein QAD02_007102 [Eretmocerus hayati]
MNFSLIFSFILTFILELYADPYQNRKIVDTVILFSKSFLGNVLLPCLKNDILKIFEGENGSDEALKRIHRCSDEYGLIIPNFVLEYKRFKLLRPKGFIEPEKFKLGTEFRDTIVGNETISEPHDIWGICIPLRKSLKFFLEIPGMLEKILCFMENLSIEPHIKSSILQGVLWHSKYATVCQDIILPLNVFCDDLECGNPLGSHAGVNKFTAVYLMLACLPPSIAALLDCIIFHSLFRSANGKSLSNDKVFKKLEEELKFLSREGIQVKAGGIVRTIKFKRILFLADNLGFNAALGFNEGFTSDYYCRICRCSKYEA